MQIVKTGDEQFRMTLTPMEALVFANGMRETMRRISAREYPTRMGAELEQIRATIASLEAALK
jgi:hypothetical protein